MADLPNTSVPSGDDTEEEPRERLFQDDVFLFDDRGDFEWTDWLIFDEVHLDDEEGIDSEVRWHLYDDEYPDDEDDIDDEVRERLYQDDVLNDFDEIEATLDRIFREYDARYFGENRSRL